LTRPRRPRVARDLAARRYMDAMPLSAALEQMERNRALAGGSWRRSSADTSFASSGEPGEPRGRGRSLPIASVSAPAARQSATPRPPSSPKPSHRRTQAPHNSMCRIRGVSGRGLS
jgi:hypothetical protein